MARTFFIDETVLPDLLPRCRTLYGQVWRYGILLFPRMPATDAVGAKIDEMAAAAAAAEAACTRH